MVMSRYNRMGGSDYEPDEEDLRIRLLQHAETDKATLFSIDTQKPKFWLPKSQTKVMATELKNIKMVVMPEWLAVKNKIDCYAE